MNFTERPNIIIIVKCRMMRSACSTRQKERNRWRTLVDKHEENRRLRRSRRRWKVNIKMDPPEVEWDGLECVSGLVWTKIAEFIVQMDKNSGIY